MPQAADSIGTGVVVEIISIEYDQWQPAWLVNKSLSKPLYLPVDSTFAASTYRLQVSIPAPVWRALFNLQFCITGRLAPPAGCR